MTTEHGRMASRAFESNTPEILEAGFGKIRGSNPRIAGIMAVSSWIDNKANLATIGNARTRRVNPLMAGGAYLFLESDDLRFANDSTISLRTTKEGGVEVTLPRHFCRYSSQSFLNPTDIALQLAPNWVAKGHRLAAMQSPLRTFSLSIQIIPQLARL